MMRIKFLGSLVLALVICQLGTVAHAMQDQIGIGGAWNAKLADGDLTYKVSGGDQTTRDMMSDSIQLWADAINARLVSDGSPVVFTLTEVFGRTKPNIDVKFKKGGGQIQGQALSSFDSSGFVDSVKINVSGKAFGTVNLPEVIGQIVKHEFGHALGLIHANFSGDLMSTSVNAGALDISECDIDGVFAANHWLFVDNAGTPHHPHVSAVFCGGGGPGPTPTPTPTPTPAPTDIVAHVEFINPFTVGNKKELRLGYLIHDENENPAAGVTVSTTIQKPNGDVLGGSANTGADGIVTFFLRGKAKNGSYTVVVTNISGSGVTYDDCVVHGDLSIDQSTITFDLVGGSIQNVVVVDDCPPAPEALEI